VGVEAEQNSREGGLGLANLSPGGKDVHKGSPTNNSEGWMGMVLTKYAAKSLSPPTGPSAPSANTTFFPPSLSAGIKFLAYLFSAPEFAANSLERQAKSFRVFW
jgi:hypothetical protein